MQIPTVDDVNGFVAETYPPAAHSGMRCTQICDQGAEATWTYDSTQLRPGGYISGPTIFSLADLAMWFSTFTVIGIEPMAVTIEMSLRFLRPALDGDLVAKSMIQSVTRRRIVGSIEMWIAGSPERLVAVAQGTYARPA